MEGDAMRVLIAIDGSDNAATALDLVAGIAWPEGSVVRVVEAVDPGASSLGGPWPTFALLDADRVEADIRAFAERNVADARARLERDGLTVEGAALIGRAAIAIVDQARAMEADLIVIGSRGHGTIESMLLGSTSAEVIDHASVPVLVARDSRIDRVVLAWDGSACASLAADLVRCWPVFSRSAIHVVTVSDSGVPWWTGFPEPGSPELMPMYLDSANARRHERDELAHAMCGRLTAAGLSVEEDRREGDAATQILAAARDARADLIVMGTHGRTGLARLVIGSVARNVLHHASASVLVVREGSPATRLPPHHAEAAGEHQPG
jgi:nucleotide-binding universal stress UspA family protein